MINTFNKSVYFFENYSVAIRLREDIVNANVRSFKNLLVSPSVCVSLKGIASAFPFFFYVPTVHCHLSSQAIKNYLLTNILLPGFSPPKVGGVGGGLRFPDLSRREIKFVRKNKSLFVKAN